MAKFHFKKYEGVIDAPLSFVGYSGELTDLEKYGPGFVIAEYNIVCGDIGANSRDEKLANLRKDLEGMGHEIIIDL